MLNELKSILTSFEKEVGATRSAIVTVSGFTVASTFPEPTLRTSATAASLMGSAGMVSAKLALSPLNFILIEGKEGRILIKEISKEIFFVTTVRPEQNVGLVLIRMDKAIEKIRKVLG